MNHTDSVGLSLELLLQKMCQGNVILYDEDSAPTLGTKIGKDRLSLHASTQQPAFNTGRKPALVMSHPRGQQTVTPITATKTLVSISGNFSNHPPFARWPRSQHGYGPAGSLSPW